MNYGMAITGNHLDSNTFLAIANAYVNKKFSNYSVDRRRAEYDNYAGGSKSYYRKFQCTMRQGISSSVLSSHGVTAVKKNGIYYLDYTEKIHSLLAENEKVAEKHRMPSLEDYIAETRKNLTLLGQVFYDYVGSYEASRTDMVL